MFVTLHNNKPCHMIQCLKMHSEKAAPDMQSLAMTAPIWSKSCRFLHKCEPDSPECCV